MIVIPRYEPVFVEPNLKEYETQVLQMSVPIDDLLDDGTFRRNKAGAGNEGRNDSEHFSLDSISYITKDRMSYGQQSSSPATSGGSSERTRTTYRMKDSIGASSAAGTGHYSTLDDDPITPIRKPLFTRRDDGEEGMQHMSVGAMTNANVMFGAGDLQQASAAAPGNFTSSTPARRKQSFGEDAAGDMMEERSPIDATTQL
jgi:hypothetical protein